MNFDETDIQHFSTVNDIMNSTALRVLAHIYLKVDSAFVLQCYFSVEFMKLKNKTHDDFLF